jgi:hypothetical protein
MPADDPISIPDHWAIGFLIQSDEGRDDPGERASPTSAISNKPGITPVQQRFAMGFAAMTAQMPNALIANEPSQTKKCRITETRTMSNTATKRLEGTDKRAKSASLPDSQLSPRPFKPYVIDRRDESVQLIGWINHVRDSERFEIECLTIDIKLKVREELRGRLNRRDETINSSNLGPRCSFQIQMTTVTERQ